MNYNIISNLKSRTQINSNINLKLNEEKLNDLLNNFCNIKTNNEIELNYNFFKIINTFIDKNYILDYLICIIENVLTKYQTFIVHVNIEKLTLLEIDKNKSFVQDMSNLLKERFPDRLEICYIYEGSFIFKQIYSLLSIFIDKKTLKKIKFQE
jgi:hypothetical protein